MIINIVISIALIWVILAICWDRFILIYTVQELTVAFIVKSIIELAILVIAIIRINY